MLRSSELYGSTRARLVSRRVARVAVEGLGNPSLGLPRWLVALAAAPPDPVLEPRSGRARFAGVRDRRRGRVRRRRRGLGRAWSLRARPVERLLLPRAPGRRPRRAPRHLAIIMDGNARWAEHRRLSVNVGHERGVDALRAVVRCCGAWGVPALTVYAFSHENWKRGRDEVDHLMALLERTLVAELPDLAREGVRVTVMGDVGMLTQNLRDAVRRAEDATRGNAKLRLNVALSYSARRDIVAAARGLAAEVAAGHLDAEDITERVISERLSSRVLPADVREPDLLIRTSGEQRLSNFMLWEAAYAELYFAEELWPDFTEASLRDALRSYAKRQRRFGRRGYGDEWPTDTRADAETEGEG